MSRIRVPYRTQRTENGGAFLISFCSTKTFSSPLSQLPRCIPETGMASLHSTYFGGNYSSCPQILLRGRRSRLRCPGRRRRRTRTRLLSSKSASRPTRMPPLPCVAPSRPSLFCKIVPRDRINKPMPCDDNWRLCLDRTICVTVWRTAIWPSLICVTTI